jgi:hypothetical protein
MKFFILTSIFLMFLASAASGASVGVHFTDDQWDQVDRLQEIDPLMVRISIEPSLFHSWNRHPEKFDWSKIDGAISANTNRKVLVTLSPWYRRDIGFEAVPRTENEKGKFLEWVAEFCVRYGQQVCYWQLDNEISTPGHWPTSDYAIFADLLIRFNDLIKSRFSESKVCWSIGTVQANYERAKDQLIPTLNLDSYDVIDVHYHTSWDDVGLARRVAEIKALTGKEIISTENSTWTDKPINAGYQSEYQQASHFVRSVFSAFSQGATGVLYAVLADRPDRKPNRFSLHGYFWCERIYSNGYHSGPKAIVQAMQTMTDLLEEGSDIRPTTELGKPFQRFSVDGPNHNFDVLWWQGSNIVKTRTIRVSKKLQEVTVVDAITGEEAVIPVSGEGQVTLQMKKLMPIYLLR